MDVSSVKLCVIAMLILKGMASVIVKTWRQLVFTSGEWLVICPIWREQQVLWSPVKLHHMTLPPCEWGHVIYNKLQLWKQWVGSLEGGTSCPWLEAAALKTEALFYTSWMVWVWVSRWVGMGEIKDQGHNFRHIALGKPMNLSETWNRHLDMSLELCSSAMWGSLI